MNYRVSDALCGCESGGVVSMFQINYTRQEYSKWDSDANRALTIINIAMKRRSAEFLAILEKPRLVHCTSWYVQVDRSEQVVLQAKSVKCFNASKFS